MAFKRRDFLATAGLTLFSKELIQNTIHSFEKQKLTLPEGATILFQGDSITDGGRNRSAYYPNQLGGMGTGYVLLTAATLLKEHPEKNLHIYNRGISGNKVYQLSERWEDDCLQLEPDVLSIMIGVNDFWHILDFGYDGSAQKYEGDYRNLLSRTKEKLPNVRLLIASPFYFAEGTAIKADQWGPFAEYREISKALAKEFSAVYIDYQPVFNAALKQAPVSYWCPDGVHPSMAGIQLMAETWLAAFNQL